MNTVTLEQAIVAQILAALRKIPGVVVRKRHGTAMGVSGDPDLYGSFRGRHFEIEVKRPGEKPTKLQLQRLLEWRLSNAIVGVAWSKEDALKILGLLPRPWITWTCESCKYIYEGAESPAQCPCCSHLHFDKQIGPPEALCRRR